jgi:hypothetical protein
MALLIPALGFCAAYYVTSVSPKAISRKLSPPWYSRHAFRRRFATPDHASRSGQERAEVVLKPRVELRSTFFHFQIREKELGFSNFLAHVIHVIKS